MVRSVLLRWLVLATVVVAVPVATAVLPASASAVANLPSSCAEIPWTTGGNGSNSPQETKPYDSCADWNLSTSGGNWFMAWAYYSGGWHGGPQVYCQAWMPPSNPCVLWQNWTPGVSGHDQQKSGGAENTTMVI